MKKNTQKIDVVGCARCGGTHKKLKFFEFIVAPKLYSHWASCPTTGEPILMYVRQPSFLKMAKYRLGQLVYMINRLLHQIV